MGDKKGKSTKSSKLKKMGHDEKKMVPEENGGDALKSTKPKKKRTKSPEKMDNGKTRKKDKRHLSAIPECDEVLDGRSSAGKEESDDDDFAVKKTGRIKEESDDDDFAENKTGRIKDDSDDEILAVKLTRHKRKRAKDEPEEDLAISNGSPTPKEKRKDRELEDGEPKRKKKKKAKEENEKTVKKEEGEDRAVSKKSKRTKEKRGKEGEGRGISKTLKRTKREKKEEGGEEPISSKKPKKTKEEIEEAKQLKIKMKEEEEQNRWRWWEEEKYEDGVKWKNLEHKGPYFPPEYQPLPDNVRFLYNGTPVKLSLATEEPALFFAQMLDHEYTTKDVFRQNFFTDWRKEMTHEERKLIKDLNKCDFGEMHAYHKAKVEARKNFSKEEKLVLKEANQKIVDEFGFCMLDHHKERIGNFKIEPPGLFRGRGEHPKQGMLKKRILPEAVIINCAKESSIPVAPAGHRWKEVRHDNTVTWLVSWNENIQGATKYIMLNPSSKLKGEKDWEKYEIARKLKSCVESIRNQYQLDLKSKQMGTRQRAVALYFIDKLALRAGNEKEEGESADTVGCCSLRVEHITLHDMLEGSENVVEFDFLGKDSIRYYNKVPVIKKVFKSVKLFMENKEPGDDLFDRLNTQVLNKHLSSLMPGLSAKVFRTFNASITLQQQLKELSNVSDIIPEKLLSYNRANRAVAILCNHQRAVSKTFDQSMATLQSKIVARREQLALAKTEFKQAKKDAKTKDPESKVQTLVERKKKAVERCEEQLLRMEVQATDREENKQIALGTSKLNYLDPRISVAWCKNMDVPVDKIYNKTQRERFAWALDMTEADFEF